MSFNLLTESGDALLTESGDNLVIENSDDPDFMAIANELMFDARCIACIPEGMRIPVLISIFANLAGMSAEPSQLMANAKCIANCIPEGMLLPVLISVAQGITSGGGGGTGLSGSGSPEGVVTASPGTTYLDTSTGNFWAKQSGVGNTGWLELIAT